MRPRRTLQQAADWVATAQRLVVLTGAGVSRESGIPTFRDALEGLWATYDPQELASPQGFNKNPALVWQWYAARRRNIASVLPNPAHHALATLASQRSVQIITQNVDELHEAAGSEDVIHLHGSLTRYKCVERQHPYSLSLDDLSKEPPSCPQCGALIRPDVVWFGEMLPTDALEPAIEASERCDVMLVVGTSGLVHPAASLPLLAAQNGARTVEINPEPTALTSYLDLSLRGPAGEILPALLAAMEA